MIKGLDSKTIHFALLFRELYKLERVKPSLKSQSFYCDDLSRNLTEKQEEYHSLNQCQKVHWLSCITKVIQLVFNMNRYTRRLSFP